MRLPSGVRIASFFSGVLFGRCHTTVRVSNRRVSPSSSLLRCLLICKMEIASRRSSYTEVCRTLYEAPPNATRPTPILRQVRSEMCLLDQKSESRRRSVSTTTLSEQKPLRFAAMGRRQSWSGPPRPGKIPNVCDIQVKSCPCWRKRRLILSVALCVIVSGSGLHWRVSVLPDQRWPGSRQGCSSEQFGHRQIASPATRREIRGLHSKGQAVGRPVSFGLR